ncbi:YgjP-like metallopeptidase domain-containing protein [Cellulomonas sp.]|uniref:YgjP-like metallopeptidase domain-containing protein n=1 Tax=Cellulomonas sp. TaxID=40001 RepID=UPI001B22F34A|nr:YgjP-like metallopeptidase domain-containing protein [Cellulomonas sp.]MBO9554324.1 M48 family metallopeptidase [Cellulomonas sp.]
MQPSTHDLSQVEVRRSRKRVRTVTAWREGERTIVAIPARFTHAQEREWVRRMLARLAAQERRRRPSDTELASRATELSARYLGGRAVPTSVTWSTNQGRRWGSCTPTDGTIRISDRVRGMPRWVLDYVLLHELNHLLHAGHGPDFWAELEGYPRTQRARGFLEGYAFAGEPATGRGGEGPPPADAREGEDDVFEDDVAGELDDVLGGIDGGPEVVDVLGGITDDAEVVDVVAQVDAGR